ncbi:membrane protein involved in the export of O-antigen and teichoic acid [Xenococcus sp. PCC 7305]|uniref:oligosaccharide flippase family protein n=1 Tax=Xenococcus sp. PCC 7305 TaxID=102125 RepID=UPI0002AC6B83|nr:oligosaccharide flippase family protein [Xenococcus sp. PCC 7305]ELS02524.1 membrane protein involved in the export of O-antigen and teichoic acid [Xenococcus sp. PCC 7305]
MKLAAIKEKIINFARQGLVKEASWLLIAKLFNVFVQAAYFIIVARVLGPENYGSFIGVTALASIVFPFVAMGAEHVLLQKVATKPNSFPLHWGNTLLILFANGAVLSLICLIISPLFFGNKISLLTIVLIIISDLICVAVVDFSSKALMSVYLAKKTSQLIVFSTSGKLLAALCLAAFFENPSIETWAILYAGSYVVISILSIAIVNRLVGNPKPKLSSIVATVKQGFFFSIGTSAHNINANLDKTMLASMAGLQATGIYGSAYRFIDVGNVPINSLFGASYTRFFKYGGESGIRGTLKFARKLLPYLLGYSIVCFIGYHVFAPAIPYILGAEYQNAIGALLWLSPLPPIFAFQLLAADTLTGAGYQRSRSIIQTGAAVLNVGLNIWLIPLYSWKGAAWATVISDALRMICLWVVVFWLAGKMPLAKTKK